MPAWTESDWDLLLSRVAAGKCMPFLGAGASFGALPLGGAIARDWAKQFGYPFEDTGDLARVAQYLALVKDPAFPKELILDLIEKAKPPAFQEPDEPHGVLAELPLPIYMTTNYDGFMTLALRARMRDVRRELCRWGVHLDDEPSAFEDAKFKPDLATPVVYHLHGHTRADSLVLTEDDYLRFLGSMTQGRALMPAPLESALASFALVFIGYRLADWNFRVLLQALRPKSLRRSVVVMVPPDGAADLRQQAQAYLDKFYEAMELKVYWGTARSFCGELRTRWQKLPKSAP